MRGTGPDIAINALQTAALDREIPTAALLAGHEALIEQARPAPPAEVAALVTARRRPAVRVHADELVPAVFFVRRGLCRFSSTGILPQQVKRWVDGGDAECRGRLQSTLDAVAYEPFHGLCLGRAETYSAALASAFHGLGFARSVVAV